MSELEHHMTLETLELKLRDKLGALPPQVDEKTDKLKLNLVVPCRLDQKKERNIFRSVINNFATIDDLPFPLGKPIIHAKTRMKPMLSSLRPMNGLGRVTHKLKYHASHKA